MNNTSLTIRAAILIAVVTASAAAQSGTADRIVALVNASIISESQGNYAHAVVQMDSALGMSNEDYLVVLRSGWVNYLNGNYTQSEKHYRRAGELAGGKSIEALLGLTLPLAARNDWTKVEQTYMKVLDLDPLNYDANLRLGQIYANRSDHVRADKYFRTVLSAYPSNYEANLSAGWNSLNLGDKGTARQYFTHALMLSPADTSATRGLEKSR